MNRDRIMARLPNRSPNRMWSGPSEGGDCALCGDQIAQDEFEVELQFSEYRSDPVEVQVHVDCLTAWGSERDALDPSR